MEKMKFRMFTFPENPETFSIAASRTPEYTIADDGTVTYEGLGPLCRVITGSGVFHGEDAVDDLNALAVIMAAGSVGELVHPVWGSIQACLTGLELDQESREDYVAYKFTFREADESGMIPRLPDTTQ